MMASIPFPDVSPTLFSVDIPLWQFSLAGMDFSLGGFELALRWYALAYIAGILLASWIMRRALRRPALWPQDRPAFSESNLDDLITWLIFGIIIGGRLGYVLFYNPSYYLANPVAALRIFDGACPFTAVFWALLRPGYCFAASTRSHCSKPQM